MAGFYRWLSWSRKVEERLAASLASGPEKVRGKHALADQFNRRIRRLSFAERLERQLAAVDSSMTASEFVLTRAGIAAVCFLAGWLLAGHAASGLLLAVLGWMGPAVHLKMKLNKRAKDFGDQLPDMLSMLVGSLRAGYGLLHAVTVIETEMPEPIASEFGRVVKETALGYTVGDALDHLVERVDNEDLALIVTAIHIQHEVGGSLADVLETISQTIRERIQLYGEVRAITSQQRATGYVLSGLPIIVGAAITLLSPDYMMGIFQPGWPLIIPIAAGCMVIIGNIIMRKVIQIDV